MKTIATIIFIIFIGTAASAQNANEELKVDTIEMGIVTGSEATVKMNENTQVARLYKFKNSRVKKELAFATKRNSPKMA